MNSLSLSIFILGALLGSDCVRGSTESSESPEYREQLLILPICPTCHWKINETNAEYNIRTLTSGGPKDGRCEHGHEKWIYRGEPYGFENDVCCCLKVKVAPINCKHPSTPVCPPIPQIGRDEFIKDYFLRVAKELKDAPENGCCPLGTFKWIFKKSWTEASKELCSCIDTDNYQDFSRRCV